MPKLANGRSMVGRKHSRCACSHWKKQHAKASPRFEFRKPCMEPECFCKDFNPVHGNAVEPMRPRASGLPA